MAAKTKSKSKVKAKQMLAKKAAPKSAKKKAVSAKTAKKGARPAAKAKAPKGAKGSGKKTASKATASKKADKSTAKKAGSTKAAKGTVKKAAPVKATAAKKKAAAPKKSSKPQKAAKAEKVSKKAQAKVRAIEEVFEDAALNSDAVAQQEAEAVLTDAEGRRYCRVKDCDQISAVDAYCRYHYLLFWKKIQIRKKILTEGKLEKYIEELTARYPDKYLDMLRKDLRSEKEFLAAIQELEIDDSSDDNIDEEDSQSFIEEVRGMSETTGRSEDDY